MAEKMTEREQKINQIIELVRRHEHWSGVRKTPTLNPTLNLALWVLGSGKLRKGGSGSSGPSDLISNFKKHSENENTVYQSKYGTKPLFVTSRDSEKFPSKNNKYIKIYINSVCARCDFALVAGHQTLPHNWSSFVPNATAPSVTTCQHGIWGEDVDEGVHTDDDGHDRALRHPGALPVLLDHFPRYQLILR